LALDCTRELVQGAFAAKEKGSIFLPKVEKSPVRADRGANRIKVLLEVWASGLPVRGFYQNFYPSVKHLASQVHPSQLTKKAQRGLAARK